MAYQKLTAEEQKEWKDMFQRGSSFGELAAYFAAKRDRVKSPFDFADMFKGANGGDIPDMDELFGKGKKPKKKK